MITVGNEYVGCGRAVLNLGSGWARHVSLGEDGVGGEGRRDGDQAHT